VLETGRLMSEISARARARRRDLGVGQPPVVRPTRTAASLRQRLPARISPVAIAIFGTWAAAGVGYLTSQNPTAEPAHGGVLIRILIIGTITVAAVYAQTSVLQSGWACSWVARACSPRSGW